MDEIVDEGRMSETIQPIESLPPAARGPVRLFDLFVPLLTTLVWFAVLFGAAFAAGLIGKITGFDAKSFFTGLPKNFVDAQIFMATIYFAMLVGIWQVARRHGPSTLTGYFARVPWRTILLAIFSGMLLAGIVIAVVSWLEQSGVVAFHTTAKEELLLEAHGPWQLLLSFSVIAIIAPFVEELYFRGLLLAWLRRWLALPLAGLLNAALFALVHGRFVDHPGLEGLVLTLVVGSVGLLNVVWFARTRSLWPPVATHAFYNGTLLLVTFFSGT
jgi:hypothetical protein